MTDIHSKETRSYNMSRIKSKDTKPEMIIRKYLFAKGYRYRINVKGLPGKPDVVLKKYNTVIFVNGCFWHGHKGCRYFILPKTRADWWEKKIEDTVKRDNKSKKELINKGWNVITIWECQLKKDKIKDTLESLEYLLNKNFLDLYH